MKAVDLVAQSPRSAQRTLREAATGRVRCADLREAATGRVRCADLSPSESLKTGRVRCADLTLAESLAAGPLIRAELTAFFAPYQKDFGAYAFDRDDANAR